MVVILPAAYSCVLSSLLLAALFIGEARAEDEFESPSHRALNEAAAEVPGDGLTDLLLSLQLGKPVGSVVSIDLEVAAPQDVDPALPLALHANDFNRVGKDPEADRRIAERLRAPAVRNAYYAVALLEISESLKDVPLQREAVRLGAHAEVYETPFLESFDRLGERYLKLDPELFGSVPEHLRGHEATWDTVYPVMPRISSWLSVCKQPPLEIKEDCAALARRILADATTAIEAAVAAGILDHHEQAVTGLETFEHRLPVLWLLSQAGTPLGSFDTWPVDRAKRYIENLRTKGELTAMRQLLVEQGVPIEPPAGWRPASAKSH